MARKILTFVFLIIVSLANSEHQKSLINTLEEKLENKFADYANDFAKWLETVNDRHLNYSVLGKMLNYNEVKPKLDRIGSEARGLKKLSLALLPIIFHIGATSTWLVLTGLMTVKSVAIGIILLVFKIAVSSAKVASFFTAWKHKHHHQDHSWAPHYEYHGHYRSLYDAGINNELPYQSYSPDWSSGGHTEYKSIPTSYIPASYPQISYEKEQLDKKHSI